MERSRCFLFVRHIKMNLCYIPTVVREHSRRTMPEQGEKVGKRSTRQRMLARAQVRVLPLPQGAAVPAEETKSTHYINN